MTARVGVCIVAYRRSKEWEAQIRDQFTRTAKQSISIRIRHNDQHQKGLSICKNELALEGEEPYLIFCNDDVCPSPGWDDQLVDFLEQNRTCGAVLPIPVGDRRHPEVWRPFVKGEVGNPTPENMERLAADLKDAPPFLKYEPTGLFSPFFAVLMSRDTWEKLKGFDGRFRFFGSDRDLMFRFINSGYWVAGLPRCPFWHKGGDSIDRNEDFRYKREFQLRSRIMEAMGRGQLKRWHNLTDTERAEVTRDPVLSKIGAEAPAISFIIPTLGRDSLRNALESVMTQLAPYDEAVVIGDGPQPFAAALSKQWGARYEETPTTRCWGHAQRNHGMDIANGDYLAFLDDDDVATPTAVSSIRKAILENPGHPFIFRMIYQGRLIWKTREMKLGNVSTHMYVFPKIKEFLARWKAAPESPKGDGGDFHWLKETLALWPKGSVRWIEEPIAVLEKHHKGSML